MRRSLIWPYAALLSLGFSTRLLRVGFVGELGYEIHAPANSCIALWQALMEAGDEFGIAPFGVAAQRLLRLEKGHLIFGQDTDGMTNPFEVNLGWGVRLGKERFVGKHALEVLKPRDARKLIGFERVEESDEPLRECNLIIERGGPGRACHQRRIQSASGPRYRSSQRKFRTLDICSRTPGSVVERRIRACESR